MAWKKKRHDGTHGTKQQKHARMVFRRKYKSKSDKAVDSANYCSQFVSPYSELNDIGRKRSRIILLIDNRAEPKSTEWNRMGSERNGIEKSSAILSSKIISLLVRMLTVCLLCLCPSVLACAHMHADIGLALCLGGGDRLRAHVRPS